ncbi:MFS transporter [Sphingopyxis sp. BSNA05]|uniref:MFS transporter n=1 Tax=Sphingopyxis sp. BSNA05 TaxID=1236614 RepID=UPI001565C79B|nr:MFS transporter [Sphingopyxis sp. BSNA05]
MMFSLALISNVTPLLLRLADLFPANGEPMLLYLLMGQFAFTIMTTIAGGILAVSMIADVTDQIQLETGYRSEGLLFSASTMVNKAVSGMGILLAGLLLAFVNFPDKAQPGLVSGDVLQRLAGIYIGTTALATVLAIICLAYYPINRLRHIENIRQLSEKTL